LRELTDIDAGTKIAGLVGRNISYSLSPRIHNFSIQELGLNALYLPFDLPETQLPAFLQVFAAIGGVGLSVTTPHKLPAAALVKGHKLKSINTIFRGKKHDWEGTSTDIEGLALAMRHIGVEFLVFSRFIILGNGGVVAAIVDFLKNGFEKSPEIFILRRNENRDDIFKQNLPEGFALQFRDFTPAAFDALVNGAAGETLVIQATNAPHASGDVLQNFAPSLARFNGVFVDLTYGKTTALLSKARDRGLPCQDGLPMLIEQARLAQKLWWGQAAPYQKIHDFITRQAP